MAGLGDTTAFLKRLQKQAGAAGPAMPSGRCREVKDFGANPGDLHMLLYVPDGLPPGAPLVVALHGCTQFGEAYAQGAGWLDLADRLGFAVLAPEQLPVNNPNRCFNWFSAEDAGRGRGEAASIAAMVGWAVREHRLDAGRVFVTGLSAGGAMTAVMLAAYPELFAGGAVIAGLPYGVAKGVPDALRLMQGGDGRDGAALADLVRRAAPDGGRPIRLTIWHGDADLTVHPANGRDLAQQWSQAAGIKGAGQIKESAQCTRRTWRSSAEDGSVIELVTIPGLGHGAPLSAAGDDGLGAAAPFMIETGLCSTRHIAAFWGLGPAHQDRPATAGQRRALHRPSADGVAARVLDSVSRHVPHEVQDVIAKALKSAGLMR